MKKLAIKDVAEQTGVAAGTIRMWEQRYGFPEPARTAAGYRVYTEQDVVALRRVVAYRERGLVGAGGARARAVARGRDRPPVDLRRAGVRRRRRCARRSCASATLIALSRAIEEEAMARAAGPVVIGAFQSERNYRAVEHRYRRLAHVADAVGVFADFAELRDRQRGRAGRDPDRQPRRARPRVGGDRRRARLRRVPGRLGDAVPRRRADLRGGLDDGRAGRAPRRAGRCRARGARRARVVRAPARRSSPTARSRSRRRRPGSPR